MKCGYEEYNSKSLLLNLMQKYALRRLAYMRQVATYHGTDQRSDRSDRAQMHHSHVRACYE
jgi:hypothetical protein